MIVQIIHPENLYDNNLILSLRELSDPQTDALTAYLDKLNKPFSREGKKIYIHLNELEINNIFSGFKDEKLKNKIETTIKKYFEYNKVSYKIKNRTFYFNQPYLMGILNVTPDSFSDRGKYFDSESAFNYAVEMINEGADIVDIGGESTRPGSESVDENEELDRIIPVIDKILKVKPDAIISVDTTKSKVAAEALKHKAAIVNDISGATFDPEILNVVKEYNSSLILMHIKGIPKTMQKSPQYDNVVEEVYDFLSKRSKEAEEKKIQNIFIDPGIGFGKRIDDNFQILKRLNDFKSIGYPVVIGVSRKSFLGKTFNLDINERDTATAVAEAIAIQNSARIIRTHNIKYGKQVCGLLKHLN